MGTKYLYGASVQGIQGFIFQTDRLQEIAGASELVENICTKLFWKISNSSETDPKNLLNAAGNIKYLFESKEKCADLVKAFPKVVMDYAPGITISQAVIELTDSKKLSKAWTELEEKLKTQRSIIGMPYETGYMGLERARRTGGVVWGSIDNIAGEKNDEATFRKIKEKDEITLYKRVSGLVDLKAKQVPFNIEDIAKSDNSWIAVIHADGNGLGKILQDFGEKLLDDDAFAKFSKSLQRATEAACKFAFTEIIKPELNVQYPARPILLGGDDLTIITRADLALNFTQAFLTQFEKETTREFEALKIKELPKGLTACAGIAYVKKSYPLHYALEVAEELCGEAKKMVKHESVEKRGDGLPKSSVSFFKIQDSFVEKLEAIRKRTQLTMGNINYHFGPYFLTGKDGDANLETLQDKLRIIKEEAAKTEKSKGISKLRKLISASFKDPSAMEIMKDRMKEVNNDLYKSLDLDNAFKGKSPLYDLIQLHSFKTIK